MIRIFKPKVINKQDLQHFFIFQILIIMNESIFENFNILRWLCLTAFFGCLLTRLHRKDNVVTPLRGSGGWAEKL